MILIRVFSITIPISILSQQKSFGWTCSVQTGKYWILLGEVVVHEVAKVTFLHVSVCPRGGAPGGVPALGVGVWRPPPKQTATVADGTHPTGMHSCLPVYLHKTPVYSSPWESACYIMITVDRGSTSTIISTGICRVVYSWNDGHRPWRCARIPGSYRRAGVLLCEPRGGASGGTGWWTSGHSFHVGMRTVCASISSGGPSPHVSKAPAGRGSCPYSRRTRTRWSASAFRGWLCASPGPRRWRSPAHMCCTWTP